jgi:hypothetical protein
MNLLERRIAAPPILNKVFETNIFLAFPGM